MSTKKKTYTKEFKKEAVQLAKQTGKRSQVVLDLGIQVSMLQRWQLVLEQHQEKAFPGKGKPVDEELSRLQRERRVALLSSGDRLVFSQGGRLVDEVHHGYLFSKQCFADGPTATKTGQRSAASLGSRQPLC